jgi:hypothetical protein
LKRNGTVSLLLHRTRDEGSEFPVRLEHRQPNRIAPIDADYGADREQRLTYRVHGV